MSFPTDAHTAALHDTVRLTRYHPPDDRARVVAIATEGIMVSNMNMPFLGTLARVFIPHGEYVVESRSA